MTEPVELQSEMELKTNQAYGSVGSMCMHELYSFLLHVVYIIMFTCRLLLLWLVPPYHPLILNCSPTMLMDLWVHCHRTTRFMQYDYVRVRVNSDCWSYADVYILYLLNFYGFTQNSTSTLATDSIIIIQDPQKHLPCEKLLRLAEGKAPKSRRVDIVKQKGW